MHDPHILCHDLKKWNIELSDKQIGQFMDYYDLLTEWNSFMNLTAITEFEDVCKKHFVDSLSIVKAVSFEKRDTQKISLIDVGTGAGFPGIPLAIVFPELEITLLDSLQKRIHFLDHVIEKLALANCKTIHGRAEDFAKENLLREKFDYCVSRAVANLSTLSEYCLPYVKPGGYFVSYKSEKIADEAKKAEHAIQILGGVFDNQVSFTLPDSDLYRNLYVIRKENHTPKKYPRKAGLPSKDPM